MKTYRLLLFNLFLASLLHLNTGNTYASNVNTDSLISVINSGLSDSIRVSAMNSLATEIKDEYPDSAFLILEDASAILESHNIPGLVVEVLAIKASLFQNIGKYPEALQLLFEAKNILESISDLPHDESYVSNYLEVISNIGVLFFNTEKFDDAISYFQNGLDYLNTIVAEPNNPEIKKEYFRYNLNYGAVYTKIRDFDKAEVYFTKALQYLDEDDLRVYGILINNLSIIAREKNEMEKSFKFNMQAIDAWKSVDYNRGLAQGYNNLGNWYLVVGNFQSAKDSYQTALEYSTDYGVLPSAVIALQQLSIVYDTVNDYANAYKTHVRYKNLSDSLLNLDKIRLVTQLEMQEKFDIRMNKTRILQIEIEAEQRKRELFYTLGIVLSMMGFVILIMLFYLQRSKSKRHELEAEKSSLLTKSLKLEKVGLEEELEFKNKELATNVMYMIRKNELITQISERLIKSKLAFKKENQKIIDEIIRDLQSSTEEDIWKEFEIRFQQVHNEFYETLNTKFPNLSANEKRLCAFLRLNMSTKEISAITYQSVNSLTVARSRLRKKLNLDSDENLVSFLESM